MITFKQYITEQDGIKLWIDDERDPQSPIIQEKFGAHGDELWVKTAADAIDVLNQGNVISISFDHDLGPEEAGTGYDVAAWIEEQAFNGKIQPVEWRVHSANPIGAKNIEKAMSSAERFWNK